MGKSLRCGTIQIRVNLAGSGKIEAYGCLIYHPGKQIRWKKPRFLVLSLLSSPESLSSCSEDEEDELEEEESDDR